MTWKPTKKLRSTTRACRLTSGEGVYDLLVSYRSGDMCAPRIEQTEALESELAYFLDCIETNQTPFNDGEAGLRVIKYVGSGDRIAGVEGGVRLRMNNRRLFHREAPTPITTLPLPPAKGMKRAGKACGPLTRRQA